MRVLVCGGRDFADRQRLFRKLDELAELSQDRMLPLADFVVIHGDCRTGADQFADDWAVVNWVSCIAFPADWAKHPRAGDPIRNQQMLDEGRPDVVLAFPGGRGTADMIKRAMKAGVKVIYG